MYIRVYIFHNKLWRKSENVYIITICTDLYYRSNIKNLPIKTGSVTVELDDRKVVNYISLAHDIKGQISMEGLRR